MACIVRASAPARGTGMGVYAGSADRGKVSPQALSAGSSSSPAAASSSSSVFLKDLSRPELEAWVSGSLRDDPRRTKALWKWLYRDQHWATCADDMLGVSQAFRARLDESGAHFDTLLYAGSHLSEDGTRKVLFQLRESPESGLIETVLIPHRRRSTGQSVEGVESEGRAPSPSPAEEHPCEERESPGVLQGEGMGGYGGEGIRPTRYTICVSSQVGCAMNCQFCFTAKMGLRRNLRVGEIVDQVVQVRRLFTPQVGDISNVVFMGMGEPLHNVHNVVGAVNILTDQQGLHCSPNRTTVSTCGLVPEMHYYCQHTGASLALSLHATTDEVRNRIMPINRRYGIKELVKCLEEEFGGGRSRKAAGHVLVEYLLLRDVNDSVDDALRLCDLTSTFPCKINLIMFNSFPGSAFEPTSEHQAQLFQDALVRNGAKAFLRLSRGDDAMAACGQLGNAGLVLSPA